jgi:hypothetical protein
MDKKNDAPDAVSAAAKELVAVSVARVKPTVKTVVVTVLIIAVFAAGGYTVYQLVKPKSPIPEPMITAQQIIKIFEISSLQWDYTDCIVIDEEQEWKLFGLVDIDPGEMVLVSRYHGRMKLGIDGGIDGKAIANTLKEVTNAEGEKRTLLLTLPPVEILSHEKVGPTEIIFKYGKFTSDEISVERYDEEFELRKEANVELAHKNGLFEAAAESAKEQIENLLMPIPEINSNYVIEWVDSETVPK